MSKMQNEKIKNQCQWTVSVDSVSQKGVTLIELIVVISCITLLVAFGIIEFFNIRERAVRQTRLDGLKQLANAMELYKVDYANYPLTGIVTTTHILRVYFDDWGLTKIVPQRLSAEIVATGVATCLRAQIVGPTARNITPLYNINYCPEGGDNNRTFLTNQPSCCWEKGGVVCTNDANWYPCATGL